ncbi:MFS transporter [Saccharothrix variisporea]|uniref:YNFM family putative membrane transporter n=1 Tax=Saccharothrix variisporea TaxID=543527 RepID=A0A495X9F3_9PSEU|nr:MFS transporter [Saccharothrix variisporea]RKT70632.1 YNFM family putative membrane transporter [Saccharothrix variisporea]
MPTRLTTATVATGLATFAVLYAPQPVLPQIAAEFGLRPGGASLAVSAATGALALAVIPCAVLAERVGRRRVIVWSVLLAALIGLLLPLAPSYPVFLGLRVLQGVATAGIPAVAMAFLADEAAAIGAAIGALIAGNSAGGMIGRLLAGVGTDWVGWRGALGLVGGFALACALVTALYLPAGKPSVRRESGLRSALTDRVLLALYAVAVLEVSAFVSLFNVVAFRLALPPGLASLVFLAYAAGGVCSAVAGRLADRHGRAVIAVAALAVTAVGAVVTVPDSLVAVGVGLAVFTGGFFAVHAVASAWVGARARAKGPASGAYLFAFYVGSSAGGTAGSTAYQQWGWSGLVALVVGWLALAAVAVLFASRGQKSRGTTAGSPGSIATWPRIGKSTVPAVTATETERTSAGTSTTTATGKVSPP